jgi:branched-subunit amino acid ABC-type transport system permease component
VLRLVASEWTVRAQLSLQVRNVRRVPTSIGGDEPLLGFVSFLYEYADSIAMLMLSALGLIIIFGMMGVINMAHGEMMMIGAYITSFSYYAGVPIAIDPALGGVGAAIAGIVIERLMIRRFYGQLLSSLVVTWGLSLILSQGALLVFGQLVRTVPTPFGSFTIGDLSFSYYRVFLLIVALALLVGVWLLFTQTRFGVYARATVENPEMAQVMGVDTSRLYMLTFGLGTGLAGVAGGLLALTSTIGPFYGRGYTPQAFITVVVGGAADVFVGVLASVLSLGAIRTVVTEQANILIGNVAMLVFAFLVVLCMPAGMSDWIEKRWNYTRTRRK